MNRTYLCIDLKSFYASVECIDRGLDPLTTNLVVADLGRTEKTICLTVTPSLKSLRSIRTSKTVRGHSEGRGSQPWPSIQGPREKTRR